MTHNNVHSRSRSPSRTDRCRSGEQPPDDTEIYEYIFSDTIYAMNWSRRPVRCCLETYRELEILLAHTWCEHDVARRAQDQPFRLAIGSFIEDYTNSIRVIQLNEGTASFRECCAFDVRRYPVRASERASERDI